MKTFFAANLKYLRKLNNLTQTDLSAVMHKKHSTIGNWEKKISKPNIEELVELAKYLNCNVTSFLLEDLHNKTNMEQFEKVVENEIKPTISGEDGFKNMLIESLQMNVDIMKQIITTKTVEMQRLQDELFYLKQKERKIKAE